MLVQTDARDDVSAAPLSPTGVATYALTGRKGEDRGRIAHVDDTASLFMIPVPADGGNDKACVVVVPHVGEHGKRLTRFYRVDWPFMQAPHLSPLGAMIPRVVASMTRQTWLFTVSSKDEDSTLVLPVSNKDGSVVRPMPGVIGARALETKEKGEDAPRWSGWLVRWKGAKGEGWSLARTATMTDIDAGCGPRWVKAETKRSRTTQIVVGERPDGACDADVLSLTDRGGSSGPGWVAPTCDAAIALLDADVDELVKRNAVAARARSETIEREQAARAAARAAEAQITAEKKTADLAAAKKEEPFIRRYAELARKGAFAETCSVAANLSPATHVEVVVFRMSQADYTKSEATCAMNRLLTDAQKRKLEAAAAAQEREASNRATNAARAPTGSGASGPAYTPPSAPSGPSHQEQMQKMNDYTYGSGKASTSPYANTSLCR